MIPTTSGEAGIGDAITIDGVDWPRPPTLEWQPQHARSLTPSAGRPRLELWKMGDGLPNVVDHGFWVLAYMLSDPFASLNAYLEELRTDGEEHLFADWKQRKYMYTLRAGQKSIWLPRGDAYGFGGHTDSVTATVTLNGAPLTVVYKTAVAPGDPVPVGQIWISLAMEKHPTAGFHGARAEIGTAIAIRDKLRVSSYGLSRVAVADHATEPYEKVGLEEKVVYLAEVA